MGLVGISGAGPSGSEGCATVGCADEALEAQHLLERLGRKSHVCQEEAAKMSGVDGEQVGDPRDRVGVKHLNGGCDSAGRLDGAHPGVQVSGIGQAASLPCSEDILSGYCQVAHGRRRCSQGSADGFGAEPYTRQFGAGG
jgi:hypothetical protein